MASPSRSLYSDDDYSARYDSDSFASDDDVVSIRQTSYTSKPAAKKASPYTIPNKGAKGRGRGRGQFGSKHSTPQPANSVAKRMLSASRIRMNEYRNQIEELNIRIRELAEENKTLKKMQFRHQKALGKFEEQESDLPLLLTKHANEVRTLREQNRKMKDKFNQTDRYLRDAEDELENTKSHLKKYKKLCNQKGLKERDELYRTVQQSELWLEEKDSRIKELERHIEALNKNHRHEMGIELAHHRETKKQLKMLEGKQSDVVLALREKEKELEIKNIYSNRLMKASPKHHASYNGTPLHTPPPGRKKRIPSLTDLTSREKVKLYEEKRRMEEKKKSESPRHKARDIWTEKEKVSKEPLKPKQDENKVKNRIETEEEADLWIQRERNRIKLEKEEQDKRKLLEDERIKRNEQEEKESKRREEERDRRLREEQERENNWKEEIERERRERKRKEEQEEFERQERLDREKREEEERRNREKKEEERIKRLEEERKQRLEDEARRQREEEAKLREKEAEEERRRLEIDPKLQEERRKKDRLLAKLKQMDNSSEKIPEPLSMKADSPQRATFITSNPSYSPGLDSNYSTKSNYSFTKPTENLHNGLPSHDDVSIPYIEKQRKIKSKKEDEEVGGYKPSFTSSVFNSDNLKAPPVNNKTMISKNNDSQRTTIPASSERKAKLLNDLFGKKTEDTKSNEDFGFTEKVRKSSGTKTSPFPWDNAESKIINNSSAKRENSSTLFGGGSALIEFDDGFENGATKLLPKRPQHTTTTFSSKPTVNAIDNIEDDIEEVML